MKGSGHLGLAEGSNFVNNILGADSDRKVQHATRILASAFFIRHLTDAPQLADQMERKVGGTKVLPAGSRTTSRDLGAAALPDAGVMLGGGRRPALSRGPRAAVR